VTGQVLNSASSVVLSSRIEDLAIQPSTPSLPESPGPGCLFEHRMTRQVSVAVKLRSDWTIPPAAWRTASASSTITSGGEWPARSPRSITFSKTSTSMSEPQAPAPSTAQPPAKKKVSPWVWVLGGCLVLIVLVLLLMGGCTWFLADKAKEMAAEFEANPAKAAAEMAVRLNPDLELVETDEEAGTMTILQKSTGEEVTLNFEDIAEGRFSVETSEGESTISFDPQG